ncbi:MAG: Rieske 2Fe-2S domain-containing protein [Gammaproteobacteria bacterium]|nr:Rieske 2Fe-2S domain-containing protein [Gammaproteobacteria bacterium]
MLLLGKISEFQDNAITELNVKGLSLLLICQNKQFYLVENKCGHFGLPLQTGELIGNEIICAHHGISFSLDTGEVMNRPYENCDKIRVFPLVQKNAHLYTDEFVT